MDRDNHQGNRNSRDPNKINKYIYIIIIFFVLYLESDVDNSLAFHRIEFCIQLNFYLFLFPRPLATSRDIESPRLVTKSWGVVHPFSKSKINRYIY